MIRTATSTSPITYESTETTIFVDEAGNPVEIETVKSGVPVTIYYSKSGDKMVATKIVVKETTVTQARGYEADDSRPTRSEAKPSEGRSPSASD